MSDQPVHILLTMKVIDPAQLGDYFAQVTPFMGDAGIELLSAGTDTIDVLEGNWDHNRVVLMRAPSRQAWDTFYNSDAYAAIRPLRQQATESMMAVLDGINFEL